MSNEAPGKENAAAQADAKASQEQPKLKPIRLKIGDKEVDFVPQDEVQAELARGYLRQQDYTRKTMELAELRRSIQAQAAAAGSPTGGGPTSAPADPWLQNLAEGETNTVAGATGGQAAGTGLAAAGGGQAAGATPSRRAAAYGDIEDEPLELAEEARLRRLVAETIAREVAPIKAALTAQQQAELWDRSIAAMEAQIPGFKRTDVEEEIARLRYEAPGLLAQYTKLPKDIAYRLIYYERVAPRQTQQATQPEGGEGEEGGEETGGTRAEQGAPAQRPRRRTAADRRPPALAPARTREEMVELGRALSALDSRPSGR